MIHKLAEHFRHILKKLAQPTLMQPDRVVLHSPIALILGIIPYVAAHGDGHTEMEGMDMGGERPAHAVAEATHAASPSYFRYPEYQGWLYAHVATMILAWVIMLPIGIMLSIARSRLTIPAQLSFFIINALGIFTSLIYNTNTPDLYPNNAHHKIGWVVTWVAGAWFLMALPIILRKKDRDIRHEMTAHNMAQYDRLHSDEEFGFGHNHTVRLSRDSDASATLCSGSRSPSSDSVPQHKLESPHSPLYTPFNGQEQAPEAEEAEAETSHFLPDPTTSPAKSRFIPKALFQLTFRVVNLPLRLNFNPSPLTLTLLKIPYTLFERTLPILAFLALATGGITYGNLFRDRLAFSGAAHFVKGGIFFWYGILTLGRWMGAFAEYGWAWNMQPTTSSSSFSRNPSSKEKKSLAQSMPSAEFVESAVIFTYGASNVFLEHLNAWGNAWTFEDFEHISITVMFFGGGLLGMLVESKTFTSLFNASVSLSQQEQQTLVEKQNFTKSGYEEEEEEPAEEARGREGREAKTPKSYTHSLNPIPALVILLLGRMMSSHHQKSMVSTMMHAQWGSLFVFFAIARSLTYLLLYLSPPSSVFPSRPPTELVASFCLISGGMIFMGSATDTVAAVEANGLDAMFLFTVAMGFSALVMCWVAILFAVKGWALRRDAKRVE